MRTIYKVKAIAYPLIGIAHLIFIHDLPNPILAAVAGCGLIGLGGLYIKRWIDA